MKTKFLLLILLNIFSSIFAANEVKITRIMAGADVISEKGFNSITITPSDTLRIFYVVEQPNVNPPEIQFKAFLNAKTTGTGISGKESFTVLTGLTKGRYIFKIQAFTKTGWEATPAVMQFAVADAASFQKAEITSRQEDALQQKTYTDIKEEIKSGEMENMDDGGLDLQTIILYALIAISFVQLLIIGMLVIRKKREAESVQASENKKAVEPGEQFIKMPDDKELSSKKNSQLVQELKEMHLSYYQLKKELDNMKGTNTFLKNQVTSLQLNVKNLESANLELSAQKEKLMDSKHQLQKLQAQKDSLFAMAVHDIKNPAAAIKSYVELLESYDLNAQDQQEILASLVDTSSRIVNLAQQMSVIIAQQAPEPALSLEPASIKSIIDSICNRNFAYAKRKNIKLINNSSPHVPKTLMDISKMEEVIDNLVNNAIKFAPEETVVQVRTFFSETKITVEVEDNGVGLSEEDVKKAFEKGGRLSAQPTGGEGSSGLGLWIVKNIIEEHGGTVSIKSKPGVGSTFGFELPVVKK